LRDTLESGQAVKHFKYLSPNLVFTCEEYKQSMEFKKNKKDLKKSYGDLAEELGLKVGTIVSATRKGIKRYDYRIMLEEREK